VRVLSQSGEAANLGNAVHEVMARIVQLELEHVPANLVTDACEKYGVTDVDKATMCCWNGIKVLTELRPFVGKESAVEFQMREVLPEGLFELSGRADIMARGIDQRLGLPVVLIVDWKTGSKTEDGRHYNQMLSYASLGLEENQAAQAVKVVLAWLAEGERSVKTYLRADVEKWRNEELPRDLYWDGKSYVPGEQCRWCPRMASCPGHASWVEANRVSVVGWQPSPLAQPEMLAQALAAIPQLEDGIKAVKLAAKQMLETRGEDIPLREGGFLHLVERKGALKVDAAPTLAKLRADFDLTQERLDAMVTITKDALGDVLRDQFPQGEKGKGADKFLAELEASGAAKRQPPVRWVEVRREAKEA